MSSRTVWGSQSSASPWLSSENRRVRVYECRTSRREIHESLARVVSSKRLRRFPIRFDGWYRMMSSALLLLPSRSYVELDDDQVVVRMGWLRRLMVSVADPTALRAALRHGPAGSPG